MTAEYQYRGNTNEEIIICIGTLLLIMIRLSFQSMQVYAKPRLIINFSLCKRAFAIFFQNFLNVCLKFSKIILKSLSGRKHHEKKFEPLKFFSFVPIPTYFLTQYSYYQKILCGLWNLVKYKSSFTWSWKCHYDNFIRIIVLISCQAT